MLLLCARHVKVPHVSKVGHTTSIKNEMSEKRIDNFHLFPFS